MLAGRKMTFWFNRTGEVGGAVTVGKNARPLSREVQAQEGIIL